MIGLFPASLPDQNALLGTQNNREQGEEYAEVPTGRHEPVRGLQTVPAERRDYRGEYDSSLGCGQQEKDRAGSINAGLGLEPVAGSIELKNRRESV